MTELKFIGPCYAFQGCPVGVVNTRDEAFKSAVGKLKKYMESTTMVPGREAIDAALRRLTSSHETCGTRLPPVGERSSIGLTTDGGQSSRNSSTAQLMSSGQERCSVGAEIPTSGSWSLALPLPLSAPPSQRGQRHQRLPWSRLRRGQWLRGAPMSTVCVMASPPPLPWLSRHLAPMNQ